MFGQRTSLRSVALAFVLSAAGVAPSLLQVLCSGVSVSLPHLACWLFPGVERPILSPPGQFCAVWLPPLAAPLWEAGAWMKNRYSRGLTSVGAARPDAYTHTTPVTRDSQRAPEVPEIPFPAKPSKCRQAPLRPRHGGVASSSGCPQGDAVRTTPLAFPNAAWVRGSSLTIPHSWAPAHHCYKKLRRGREVPAAWMPALRAGVWGCCH